MSVLSRTWGLATRKPSLSLVAVVCAALLAHPFAAQAAQVSGNAALATDYVWRGTTQTQGDPAVQAGVRLAGDAGWYGSVWASNVEFAPDTHASSEFDVVLGWAGALSDAWALDLNLTHYRYPSTTVDLNWTELVATATLKQNYWLQLAHSTEALGTPDAGTYAQVGAKFPVSETLRIETALGHYWLDDAYGESYSHAQLGGVWAFKAPFELRVTAHATDASAKRLFPGLAGSRVEAALQASF